MTGGQETLLVAALLGLIPAFIARSKGHTFIGFWFMGAMFFIVALPWAIFMKRNPMVYRQCPHCRESVVREATACRHCGHDLPPFEVTARDPAPRSAPRNNAVLALWVLVAVTVVAATLVVVNLHA